FALLVITFFLPTTLTSSSTKSILTSPLYNVCKKRFNHYAFNDLKLQEQVSRGVETLPRTACYLMSGSLFSLRVVLNAEL
ncbi:hypothetical protein M5119_11465, partial [Lacticaseibacillus paracasei]|uniref:hypothetical protein n=1 Tax=Lacticaseibacillus paracasei TaxID=1597 RepID=UPI001C1DE490